MIPVETVAPPWKEVKVEGKAKKRNFQRASAAALGFLHDLFDFPVGGTLFQGFPLIVKGLSFGQTQFHLYLTILEVHFQGNQGVSPLLGLSHEAADLPLVKEKLADPLRLVVELVAEGVGADVGVVQECLPLFDLNVTVLQVSLAQAEGLHLGSHQGNPRLAGLLDEIIVIGFFILAKEFFPHVIIYIITPLFGQRNPNGKNLDKENLLKVNLFQ
jgi:hypothetical protein